MGRTAAFERASVFSISIANIAATVVDGGQKYIRTWSLDPVLKIAKLNEQPALCTIDSLGLDAAFRCL